MFLLLGVLNSLTEVVDLFVCLWLFRPGWGFEQPGLVEGVPPDGRGSWN